MTDEKSPNRKRDTKKTEPPATEQSWVQLFYELRGMGTELFAAEGGGEAYLRRERAEFYGLGKEDLEGS